VGGGRLPEDAVKRVSCGARGLKRADVRSVSVPATFNRATHLVSSLRPRRCKLSSTPPPPARGFLQGSPVSSGLLGQREDVARARNASASRRELVVSWHYRRDSDG